MQAITEQEHQKRINVVLDFILKNLNTDISLETLAKLANYSPFHLQKLFKKIHGVSPKQYIIQLRLETALHLLIIHTDKSIQEVSMDCGFSSPAVFSRAVKNHYGISPEKFRLLKLNERIAYMNSKEKFQDKNEANKEGELKIEIKKMMTISGIYSIAPFDEPKKIKETFFDLLQKAKAHELDFDLNSMYGILSPHQGNIYKCFLALKSNQNIPKKFNSIEISSGIYACFSVLGNKTETLASAQNFYQNWLPKSGYKIADIVGFEKFNENPGEKNYHDLVRELYVKIETR